MEAWKPPSIQHHWHPSWSKHQHNTLRSAPLHWRPCSCSRLKSVQYVPPWLPPRTEIETDWMWGIPCMPHFQPSRSMILWLPSNARGLADRLSWFSFIFVRCPHLFYNFLEFVCIVLDAYMFMKIYAYIWKRLGTGTSAVSALTAINVCS